MRFVNVFTNSRYRSSDIDVWQGADATDPSAKKLATVPFGKASDYIEVTTTDATGKWDATAYIAGSTDHDHEIISQREQWLGGEQATIVVEGSAAQSDGPASAGTDEAFLEKSNTGTPGVLVVVPGKASLGISSAALQHVAKGDAWVAGVAGKPGCLRAVSDTNSTTTPITGSRLVQYTLDPGAFELALYPGSHCEGTPDMGPVPMNPTAGSQTLVFAYGADAHHLALLVLPIAR